MTRTIVMREGYFTYRSLDLDLMAAKYSEWGRELTGEYVKVRGIMGRILPTNWMQP